MDLGSLWHQANRHAEQREWSRAEACLNAMLVRQPGNAVVLARLSEVVSRDGRYRDAHAMAMRASAAPKRLPADAAMRLLPRLRAFNEAGAFHGLLRGMGPASRLTIPQLLSCASQISYFNQQELALEYLDEAKRADPDYPPTLLARAQVLVYLGRFDEAEAELLHCQRRAPDIAQLYWLLSRLRKQTASANHVSQIRAQLSKPDRKPVERALLAYALHKELDDLGDHSKAAEALDLACRAKRSTLHYRSDDTRKLVDGLMRFVPSREARAPNDGPGVERTPVFIVGMHRSGTTLLEQLLASHVDVRGIGELYDFPVQMRQAADHFGRGAIDAVIVERAVDMDFGEIGRRYLAGLEWRLGKEHYFTDKLPSNFLNIGFIARALPHARILHMVRDPVETCFSNLRELFSDANPYSYDQLELAAYHREYRRLMAHWHAALPGRIMDVDYAELTRDPETVMRRVSEFCGLEFQPAMLDIKGRTRGVATASAVQVREGIVAREKPKWAPYAEYLKPMIEALHR